VGTLHGGRADTCGLAHLTEDNIVTLRNARWLAALSLLGLALVARAEDREVKPTQDWKGTVADEAFLKSAPADGVITDAKAFKQLWEGWKIGEKLPEIDFKKEVVIVQTTRGSQLRVGSARLTDKGDLKVVAIATRDLRPGFRYAVLVLPREGVKSVNGKALTE
jgi:hypothetical protein